MIFLLLPDAPAERSEVYAAKVLCWVGDIWRSVDGSWVSMMTPCLPQSPELTTTITGKAAILSTVQWSLKKGISLPL